jgi:hypothetical protein
MSTPVWKQCPRLSYDFLEPPSASEIAAAEGRWRARQRASFVDLRACMVCSIEIEEYEESRVMDIQSIPNKELLIPEACHHGHVLHDGMLLDMAAVWEVKGTYWGHICNTCFHDLDDAVPPVLSLANGSWVGPVPPALQDLTLAEQALVALHPHTTYHIEFEGDEGSPSPVVHSRFVHPLAAENMEAAKCLPATMEVLYGAFDVVLPVGLGFNEAALECLMVRRKKVLDALLWLKDHNHFYHDVTLSGERLSKLPIRGVPILLLQRRAERYNVSHDYHQCQRFISVVF